MFQNHLSELLSQLIEDAKFYKSLEIKKPMYKLFLTLENEAGNKIERVINLKQFPNTRTGDAEKWQEIIESMIDSMETPFDKDKELKVESDRLTQHND